MGDADDREPHPADEEDITAILPTNTSGPFEKPPEGVEAVLEVVSGVPEGGVFHVTEAFTLIGRDEAAHVRIDEPALSRQHARITYQSREFRVADLESANGTFLNGSRVKEYALRDGDKLLVGETLMVFRVKVKAG